MGCALLRVDSPPFTGSPAARREGGRVAVAASIAWTESRELTAETHPMRRRACPDARHDRACRRNGSRGDTTLVSAPAGQPSPSKTSTTERAVREMTANVRPSRRPSSRHEHHPSRDSSLKALGIKCSDRRLRPTRVSSQQLAVCETRSYERARQSRAGCAAVSQVHGASRPNRLRSSPFGATFTTTHFGPRRSPPGCPPRPSQSTLRGMTGSFRGAFRWASHTVMPALQPPSDKATHARDVQLLCEVMRFPATRDVRSTTAGHEPQVCCGRPHRYLESCAMWRVPQREIDISPTVCCAWIVGLPSGGLLTLLMGCWRL
jgi:hypothetical protein